MGAIRKGTADRSKPGQDVDTFYKSTRWKKLRAAVLRRDKYLCQEAKRYGLTVEATTVHHIFPRDKYPQYEWEPWNLISLSAKEHDEMHRRGTGDLTEKGRALLYRTAKTRGIPPTP